MEMTYFSGTDDLSNVRGGRLGDTGIAFIDSLVNKGKSLVAGQIQRVTERVADFKLLPRTHRALASRLSALSMMPAAKANAMLAANIQTLIRNLSVTQQAYNTTNATLDTALSQMSSLNASSLSVANASMLASLLTGMNDAFAKAKDLDKQTRAIESVVLTPAQQQAALVLTGSEASGVGVAGMSISTLAMLAGGGYLLWQGMRK
jgi:hypothetical protein